MSYYYNFKKKGTDIYINILYISNTYYIYILYTYYTHTGFCGIKFLKLILSFWKSI